MIKREWLDSLFAVNPWFYELRKEVRKRMAIDYKEEWHKLQNRYGDNGVVIKGEALTVMLSSLMNNQIEDTINKREKLMDEYVKTRIHTEIIGGDQHCHKVKLIVRGESRGTIPVGKDAFQAWLKNRKEVNKCRTLKI